MQKNPIYDNGKNELYNSWDIVRLYGLYEDDEIARDKQTLTGENTKFDLVPWEGKLSKISKY